MKKPVIVIPMGDPAGIGPEIVLKALLDRQVAELADCVVVGDKRVLEAAIKFCMAVAEINCIFSPEQAQYGPGIINLIDLENIDMNNFRVGEISGMCGRAAYEYIERSIQLANSSMADAVCTPPINKESLRAARVNFIGHTEVFGALTGTSNPLTMFEVGGLRVFFLSRHISLREACEAVTLEGIVDCVKHCTAALEKLGVAGGTMAVAGLNPHSGEHGMFGDEEVRFVAPAVQKLQEQGYRVEGPIGADSVFYLALQGRFNSVLSLYHDQGHIATKTYDFERTIAITNGMPILRTSVDHGTAFDIAGKGIASAVSMKEAIRLAAKYAPCFAGGKKFYK